MQPNPEHAYRDIAYFAVVLPFVDSIQSALEVKLSSRIECYAASTSTSSLVEAGEGIG